MNKEQEYIKFWTSIIDKLNEIEKDYNNLSDENKHRVDGVKILSYVRIHMPMLFKYCMNKQNKKH